MERHRLQREKNAGAYMEPAPDGNWVAFSDHAAAMSKITEELDSLRAALRDALAAHSDHAAELARVQDDFLKMNNLAYEWRLRAERAESYVAGQDVRSDFRNAGEMRIALDATVGALNTAMKEHTLLRAECEAHRKRREVGAQVVKAGNLASLTTLDVQYGNAIAAIASAMAATDAAGILRDGAKGAGT